MTALDQALESGEPRSALPRRRRWLGSPPAWQDDDPGAVLSAFVTGVHVESADLAGWDRQGLEGNVPDGFAP